MIAAGALNVTGGPGDTPDDDCSKRHVEATVSWRPDGVGEVHGVVKVSNEVVWEKKTTRTPIVHSVELCLRRGETRAVAVTGVTTRWTPNRITCTLTGDIAGGTKRDRPVKFVPRCGVAAVVNPG